MKVFICIFSASLFVGLSYLTYRSGALIALPAVFCFGTPAVLLLSFFSMPIRSENAKALLAIALALYASI